MPDYKEYSQHPLSAAFPAMAFDELEELSEDIRLNGLEDPIVLFEGKILDGWHRYQAGNMVGATLEYLPFDPDKDPVKFVLSKNLKRRHLTASQRAGIAVKCLQWLPEGRPRKGDTSKLGKIAQFSSKDAATVFQVSERTVKDARAAEKKGLGDAVRNGSISASQAARNGKPAPKKKPEPAPEPDQEVDDAQDELLRNLEQLQKEHEQLLKIVEADDRLAEARKEIKRLNEVVRILEERQVGLMNAEASAIRSAKSWKRKYEQLEKCHRSGGE